MPAAEDLHIALNDAVNEEDPEERLVKLLLDHGASPSANGCKSLVDATRKAASSSLSLFLSKDITQNDINMAFNQAFNDANFESWFTESGLTTAQLLLQKGAKGDALSESLILVMKNYTHDTSELADQFVDLLTKHNPDVNHNHGEPLKLAASKANANWTRKLLSCHPSTETLTHAFHRIFDTVLSQTEILELFQTFADYHEGNVRVDVMASEQGSQPMLAQAMSQYPRSSTVLTTLLDAGYYHDQTTTYKLYPNIDEEEEVTLLTWAIAQPQKRISTALIQILVERGGK